MASAKPKIPRVPLGSQGLEVSALGLGCMGMSASYGVAKPEGEMIELIKYAVEEGVTFLDTADFYGLGQNEIIVGKAIKDIRHKVQLATKFGFTRPEGQNFVIRGDPEYVRSACEASLKRLGADYIDLYYQHRVDPTVPIEITVGAMKKLVEEGKVKYLGLSEASAADIRRAHAVHPITAVQLEYSLWTRDIEAEILPTCRELGIGVVPFSPLGRGFFAGYKAEVIAQGDLRGSFPRMQGENLVKNQLLREKILQIAEKKNCSLNQLALAWVLHKGKDLVSIPGTTKRVNLDSNIGAIFVSLTEDDIEEIQDVVSVDTVAGDRYPKEHMEKTYHFVTSPPLASWKNKGD